MRLPGGRAARTQGLQAGISSQKRQPWVALAPCDSSGHLARERLHTQLWVAQPGSAATRPMGEAFPWNYTVFHELLTRMMSHFGMPGDVKWSCRRVWENVCENSRG